MGDAARGSGSVLLAPTVEDGLAAVSEAIAPSDLVLVKGSRSVGMDRIVAELSRRHGARS
jgi:UDP-N-acetylmuramyl pentapeptide synthase